MKIEKQAHRSKISKIFGVLKIFNFGTSKSKISNAPKTSFRGLFRKKVDQKFPFKVYTFNQFRGE